MPRLRRRCCSPQASCSTAVEPQLHWAFIPCLKQFPKVTVVPGHPRFVVDGNRITGGGISSGLDEALGLIEILTTRESAQSVQQSTQ